MIMHVKLKRAWSALGWVTATCYKIGGSVVTPRFGGLLHGELVSLHMHRGYRRVCPWTMVGVVGCGYGWVCLRRRWLVSSGEEVPGSPRELMLSFGRKLPWEGGSVADSIWGTYTVFSSNTVESPSWSRAKPALGPNCMNQYIKMVSYSSDPKRA